MLGLLACTLGCEPTSSPRNDDLELAKQREAEARAAELAGQQAAERARADERERLAALAARQAEREAREVELEPATDPPLMACRTSTWCGSRAIAEQHRQTALADEYPDALGCPARLTRGRELGEGHPPAAMSVASLDLEPTEAARARGDTDLCCYLYPCED